MFPEDLKFKPFQVEHPKNTPFVRLSSGVAIIPSAAAAVLHSSILVIFSAMPPQFVAAFPFLK